uniref:Putative secreted protein n=1 Tax=Amblyomma triste TaxID=251400 RepID=A0A023G0P9_AMBTT
MKTALLLVLLALSASSYAATISQKSQAIGPEVKLNLLRKAGKSVEALGKALSGDISALTSEDQQFLLHALTALTTSEGEFDVESEEYFWAGLFQKIFVWAIEKGVSAGVNKGVSAAINKG